MSLWIDWEHAEGWALSLPTIQSKTQWSLRECVLNSVDLRDALGHLLGGHPVLPSKPVFPGLLVMEGLQSCVTGKDAADRADLVSFHLGIFFFLMKNQFFKMAFICISALGAYERLTFTPTRLLPPWFFAFSDWIHCCCCCCFLPQ